MISFSFSSYQLEVFGTFIGFKVFNRDLPRAIAMAMPTQKESRKLLVLSS
jgi:hypothetical protein